MRTRLALTTLVLLLGSGSLPAFAAHKMFTTSAIGNGNLSSWPQAGGHTGLAAGDAICQNLAAAAGLADAALFRAWLSTSTTDAYCHVAGFSGKKSANCGQGSLPDAGPWQRTDDVAFSHRLSDLTTTFDVLHPPVVDENGSVLTGQVFTFSDTESSGQIWGTTATCNNWSSASPSVSASTGDSTLGAVGWTERSIDFFPSSLPCDADLHLLCFDPGTGAALPGQGSAPGAWVFVTSAAGTGDLGSWPQAGGATGVAAGDAICRNLAASAHFPAAGTYVAWLSVAGLPAIDRLLTDGPFRRPGGVQIAASKSELLAFPYRQSDVESDDLREHIDSLVFTGTSLDGLPTLDDCDGWTTTDASLVATLGRSSALGDVWTAGYDFNCDLAIARLLCFSNVVILFADDFESGDTSQWSATTP